MSLKQVVQKSAQELTDNVGAVKGPREVVNQADINPVDPAQTQNIDALTTLQDTEQGELPMPETSTDQVVDSDSFSFSENSVQDEDFKFSFESDKLKKPFSESAVLNKSTFAGLLLDEPLRIIGDSLAEYNQNGTLYLTKEIQGQQRQQSLIGLNLEVEDILLDDQLTDDDKRFLFQEAFDPKMPSLISRARITKPLDTLQGQTFEKYLLMPASGETQDEEAFRSAAVNVWGDTNSRMNRQAKLIRDTVLRTDVGYVSGTVDIFSKYMQDAFPVGMASKWESILTELGAEEDGAYDDFFAFVGSNQANIKRMALGLPFEERMGFYKDLLQIHSKHTGIMTENDFEQVEYARNLLETGRFTLDDQDLDMRDEMMSEETFEDIFGIVGMLDFTYFGTGIGKIVGRSIKSGRVLTGSRVFSLGSPDLASLKSLNKIDGNPREIIKEFKSKIRNLDPEAKIDISGKGKKLKLKVTQVDGEPIDFNFIFGKDGAKVSNTAATSSTATTTTTATAATTTAGTGAVLREGGDNLTDAQVRRNADAMPEGFPVSPIDSVHHFMENTLIRDPQAVIGKAEVQNGEVIFTLKSNKLGDATLKVRKDGEVIFVPDEVSAAQNNIMVGGSHPSSAHVTIETANAEKARVSNLNIWADDRLAVAMTGTTRTEGMYATMVPKLNIGVDGHNSSMYSGNISDPFRYVTNAPEAGLAHFVDNSFGITYTPSEIAAGTSEVRSVLSKRFGPSSTPITYRTSTISNDGDNLDVFGVYGKTIDTDFQSATEVITRIEQLQKSGNFPYDGGTFGVAIKEGTGYKKISIGDLQTRLRTENARVSKQNISGDVTDADRRLIQDEALSEDGLSFGMTWNETMPMSADIIADGKWSKMIGRGTSIEALFPAAQGKASRALGDPASIFSKEFYNSAINWALGEQRFKKILKKRAEAVWKQFKELTQDEQTIASRYLEKANENGWDLNYQQARFEGFDFNEAQQKFLKGFRNYWDDIHDAQNIAEVNRLRSGRNKVLELKSADGTVDTRLYGATLENKAVASIVRNSDEPIDYLDLTKYSENMDASPQEGLGILTKSDNLGKPNGLPDNFGNTKSVFYKLDKPLNVKDSSGNFIKRVTHVYGDHKNSRNLGKHDTVLEYRKGYFRRQYVDPVFVERIVKNRQGTVVSTQVTYSSPTTRQADDYARQETSTWQGNAGETVEYRVREDVKNPIQQMENYNSAIGDGSLVPTYFRGEKLGSPHEANMASTVQNTKPPIEAMFDSIEGASNLSDSRRFMMAVEARWMDNFRQYTPNGQYPARISDIGRRGEALTKEVSDAKVHWEYIQGLKYTGLGIIDTGYKAGLTMLGKYLTNKFPKGEAVLRVASKFTPIAKAKMLTSTLVLVWAPLRRWAITALDSLKFVGLSPLATVKAQGIFWEGAITSVTRSLKGDPKIKPLFKSRKTLQWLEDFEESGIVASLDSNYLIESGISEAATGPSKWAIARGAAWVNEKLRYVGQAPAEWTQNWLAYTVLRNKMFPDKEVLTSADKLLLNAKVSDINYSMTRAGQTSYNNADIGLFMQYLHVQHKALTQYAFTLSGDVGKGSKALKAEKSQLTTRRVNSFKQIEDAEQAVTDITKEVKSLSKAVTKAPATSTKRLKASKDLAKAKASLEKAEAELSSIKSRTASLDKEFKDINEQINIAEKGVKNSKQVKVVEAEIKTVEEQITTIKEELTGDVSKLTEARGKELNKGIEALELRRERLLKRVEDFRVKTPGNSNLSNTDKAKMWASVLITGGVVSDPIDQYISEWGLDEETTRALQHGLSDMTFFGFFSSGIDVSSTVPIDLTGISEFFIAAWDLNPKGMAGSIASVADPTDNAFASVLGRVSDAVLDFQTIWTAPNYTSWEQFKKSMVATAKITSGGNATTRALIAYQTRKRYMTTSNRISDDQDVTNGDVIARMFGFSSYAEVQHFNALKESSQGVRELREGLKTTYSQIKEFYLADGMEPSDAAFAFEATRWMFSIPEFQEEWARKEIIKMINADVKSGEVRMFEKLLRESDIHYDKGYLDGVIQSIPDTQMRETVRKNSDAMIESSRKRVEDQLKEEER